MDGRLKKCYSRQKKQYTEAQRQKLALRKIPQFLRPEKQCILTFNMGTVHFSMLLFTISYVLAPNPA